MLQKVLLYFTLLTCLHFSGCIWSSILATAWSDNIASATFGTQATHPALNDGNLDTVATTPARNKERVFALKFDSIKPVRRVIIYNQNLFRFDLDYRDTTTKEPTWKTAHTVRQRRDVGNKRVQSRYLIDRLNFKTDIIRIRVSRTVDDEVVSKAQIDPDDMIVNQIRQTIGGHFVEYFRVIVPAIAAVNEIEVYHLATK